MTSTAGEPTGGPGPWTGQHAGPRTPGGYPGVFRPHPGGPPVLARIDLRGSALPGVRELAGLLPRAATDIDSVLATVRPLCEDVRVRGTQAVREITARDRKSTRLNSSHANISYAVFCLKKKNSNYAHAQEPSCA